MREWYKDVGGHLYEVTRSIRHYPKRDIRHWKMLSGTDYGFMTIGIASDDSPFIEITRGAQFNGVTGYPDLECLMRAALFHDNLVQEQVPDDKKSLMLQTTCARKAADRVFKAIAKEDGSNFRARFLFRVLRAYARFKRIF